MSAQLATAYANRQLSRLSAYGIGVYPSHGLALQSLDTRKGGSVIVMGLPGDYLVMSIKQHSKGFNAFEVA
jgi:hypothetical protein